MFLEVVNNISRSILFWVLFLLFISPLVAFRFGLFYLLLHWDPSKGWWIPFPFAKLFFCFFGCCCCCCCCEGGTCSTDKRTWSGWIRWGLRGWLTQVRFQSTRFWQLLGKTVTGKKKDPPSLSLHRMNVVWTSRSFSCFVRILTSALSSGSLFTLLFWTKDLQGDEAAAVVTFSHFITWEDFSGNKFSLFFSELFCWWSQTSTTVSAPSVWRPV